MGTLILIGIYIGSFLFLLLNYFLLFCFEKNNLYLLASLYTFSVFLFLMHLSGIDTGILQFGYRPHIVPGNKTLTLLFFSASCLVAFQWSLWKGHPKSARWFRCLLVIYAICLAVSCFWAPTVVAGFIILAGSTGSSTFFSRTFKQTSGYWKFLSYNMMSFVLFSASVLVFVLLNTGLIPATAVSIYMLFSFFLLQVILISPAFFANVEILKKERELAISEAFYITKENERIVREQNYMLEEKISERTVALMDANSFLNDKLAELKDTQSQLVESEKMASLGQLTAGIAHELNNPLTYIIAAVQIIRKNLFKIFEGHRTAVIEKETFDMIDMIYDGSERMHTIIKSLRVFSRSDEDSSFEYHNIHEIIDSCNALFSFKTRDRIAVVKKYAGNIPPVKCMRGRMNQVFTNIIGNSIDAIVEKNTGDGKIEIITGQENNMLQVSIQDNGVGISEETVAKMFEPFFTTKDVGEGTGLGLSIVYNIIKKHNGEIHVVSQPGVETCVVIKLPIEQI